METAAKTEDVFTIYGEAAYNTQLMEYDLVTLWMLDSINQGLTITKQDLFKFQENWSIKTFGQLLHPLLKSNLISQEIKDFLEQMRCARNRLVHHFFLDNAMDLQTSKGRYCLVTELQHINSLIKKGEQFFSDILAMYLKDYDVDIEAIREQVHQRVDEAIQNDEF